MDRSRSYYVSFLIVVSRHASTNYIDTAGPPTREKVGGSSFDASKLR